MKKLELIDKFMLIALIFFSMMFCATSFAQEKRKGPGQAWLFTKVSDYGLSK